MKQLIHTIAIAIALTLATLANANNLALNTNFQTGQQCLEINLATSLDNQFGLFAYAAQTEGWSEAYVGPTYAPASNVQIGIAAGIESNQPSVRFGAFVWAGHKNISLLALGEAGGSGDWYRLELKYQLDAKTTVGALQEINLGTGAIVERKLDDTYTLRFRAYNGGAGDLGIKVAF